MVYRFHSPRFLIKSSSSLMKAFNRQNQLGPICEYSEIKVLLVQSANDK